MLGWWHLQAIAGKHGGWLPGTPLDLVTSNITEPVFWGHLKVKTTYEKRMLDLLVNRCLFPGVSFWSKPDHCPIILTFTRSWYVPNRGTVAVKWFRVGIARLWHSTPLAWPCRFLKRWISADSPYDAVSGWAQTSGAGIVSYKFDIKASGVSLWTALLFKLGILTVKIRDLSFVDGMRNFTTQENKK